MRFTLPIIALAALSAVCYPAVSGQDSFPDVPANHWSNEIPDRPYLSTTQASAWLLYVPGVGNQLKLTRDQMNMVKDAKTRYLADEKVLFSKRGGSREQVEHIDRLFAADALSSLTKTQVGRLREIALQLRGLKALQDDGVQHDLSLTDHQRAQIKQIFAGIDTREESFNESLAQRVMKVPKMADRRAYEAKRMEVVKAAAAQQTLLDSQKKADEARALDVLSQAQKEKWAKLQGVPFNGPIYIHSQGKKQAGKPISLKLGHT